MNKILTFLLVFSAQNALAAANFLIKPFGELPTTIIQGQSVSAFYTVTNQTNTARNGYTVQGLPSTVTQNTTSPNCSSPINLAPRASCQLELNISGPVSSNFALCKGASCTTASTPLNVSLSVFTMPQALYVINAYNLPAVSVCALNTTTGAIQSCQDAGGTFGGLPLQGIVLHNTKKIAYISNGNGSSATPFAYQCNITPNTGIFSSCTSTTIVIPSGYTPYEGMLGINSTSTLVFLTDSVGRVLSCPITLGDTIGPDCIDSGATPISSNVASVIVNRAGTTAYIGNYNSPTGVNVCAASGGVFSSCINKTGGSVNGVPFSFTNVGGVALNNTESTLYITDSGAQTIYGCSTTPSGSTSFSSCFIAYSATSVFNVILNATNTVAYLSDYSTNVYSCPIQNDGTFPTCSQTTLPGSTVGLALLY